MTQKRARTAASLQVDCLAAEGCEYVFSVPGEETMGILDALSRQAAVTHITTRHEQAAFMADVYGRLTGQAAAAMATLGPGATKTDRRSSTCRSTTARTSGSRSASEASRVRAEGPRGRIRTLVASRRQGEGPAFALSRELTG